jgi:hypothetical protein
VYQGLKFDPLGELPHETWTLTEDRNRTVIAAIEQQHDRREQRPAVHGGRDDHVNDPEAACAVERYSV